MGLIELSLEIEKRAEKFFSLSDVMSDRRDVIFCSDDRMCNLLEKCIGQCGIVDFWIETKVNDLHHLLSEITFQVGEFDKAVFTKVEIIISVPFEIPE